MVVFLVGCSVDERSEIRPVELTNEQQELVDLLSLGHQEILLFDFETVEAYKDIELWLEIYEYGTLVERCLVMGISEPMTMLFNGQLAVTINRNWNYEQELNYNWEFMLKGDGFGASSITQTTAGSDVLGRAFGSIRKPVEIQDGKEIILYISRYSRGGMRVFDDQNLQIYIEQLELIKEYPYVYIIKARFSM